MCLAATAVVSASRPRRTDSFNFEVATLKQNKSGERAEVSDGCRAGA